MVVSGTRAALAAFRLCDPRVRIDSCVRDGRRLRPGGIILRLRGRAKSLLAAERTALNFLGRLSGIATLTRQFVSALPPGSRTKILDTRKTTPLLRTLEKEAVRHGGGTNHRMSLSDAVLLKDNHISVFGGIVKALTRTRQVLGRTASIEVEVGSLRDLVSALEFGADRVLLDNMSDAEIRQAVKLAGRKIPLEVSGGVTLDRIPRLGKIGVDYISVGALTHSAPAANLSMDIC